MVEVLTLKSGWLGLVKVYVTLLPNAVVVSVEREAGSVEVDCKVKEWVWTVVLVVFRNGALGMTAMGGVEDWLTLDGATETPNAVDKFQVPRAEDEDDPLIAILVVTVEEKVVEKMVAVVKEVSVVVPWFEVETATTEELENINSAR